MPTETESRVLVQHARAVTAMRKAYQEHRFGLVLGAGVSRAFKFPVPDWAELLSRLAAHPKIDGAKVDQLGATLTSRADLLFRHFSARQRREFGAREDHFDDHIVDRITRGEWRGLIRDILYEKAPSPERLREEHPYLSEYLEVIVNSPMTITYNFDSYLEMMLATRPEAIDERGRAYETVFDGSKPFRSRTGVIYHPNGFLPQNVLERASDDLVFSEEEFGDQLIASIAGQYSSLAHHLSKNTCLFIGLSLSDENLRHFLRRNAVNNPGHFHYVVDWVDPRNPITPEREKALIDYRFSVYNLVTLFLTDSEIKALGRLLQLPYGDFKALATDAGVPTKYVYYLTGIPGIGKTTVLGHLASLSIYDEWLTDPLPLLAKPHSDLSDHERLLLDDWVARQFRQKNESLLNEKEGIFIVERGPLDPISFSDTSEIAQKARWYRERVTPTVYDSLSPGSVVLLWGDERRVSARIASRQPVQQRPDYLASLQKKLRSTLYDIPGVRDLRSTDWSIPELVREVVHVIHRDEYRPVDLDARLRAFGEG